MDGAIHSAQVTKAVTIGLTLLCLHASFAAGWVVVPFAIFLAVILVALGVSIFRRNGLVQIAILAATVLVFGGALLIYAAGVKSVGHALTLPSFLILAGLAFFFARSLAKDEEPIVIRFMRLDLGSVPDRAATYGRRLTAIWAVLLSAMALESLILSLFVDLSVWSWLVNVVNPALLIGFFFGQHLYGDRFLPDRRRASPISTIKAMLHPAVWLDTRAGQSRGER